MRNRDDFPRTTKRLLAERVNLFCSNPKCNKPTSGPSTNPEASISIGVAAHIAAAAPGGKRYDPTMSPSERKNIKNGIWLCQDCAKLIDSDEKKFTTELLHEWKRQAEARITELLESSGSITLTGNTTIIAQSNFLDQLAGYLSNDTENNLEQRRSDWRAGKKEDVKHWLRSLKEDRNRWDVISPKIRAKILRFEAGLELDTTKDIKKVKEIADVAFELDPSISNEARIRALIVRQESGAKEAVDILENQNDVDSRNMLAAFYLELNDKENCQRILDVVFQQLMPNAESHRIKALLLLVQKLIDQAVVEIEKASELAPNWTIVRYTSAIIDYFGTLSLVALPNQLMLFPEPVDMVLVKQDVGSIRRLQRAEITFLELAGTEEDKTEAELLRAWLLACKMINPEKQDEIVSYIRLVLDSNPSDFYAIYWALARNIDVEWDRSQAALATLLSTNVATMNHIIALVGILSRQKAYKAAVNVLLQTKDVFYKGKAENLWIYWNVQVLILAGRLTAAQKLVNRHKQIPEMIYAQGFLLSVKANKTRDSKSLIQYLEDQYKKTGDPLILLQICESEFRNQDWEYVADRADDLVNAFHTAGIMRLAIYAVFNARRFTKCLALINEYSNQVEKKELPTDLRQLKAVCFHSQGQIRDAIKELEGITLEKNSVELLIRRAQLYYESGDLKKLSLVGRQLVSIPHIGPSEALSMAHVLRQEDFSLAQYLWKLAVSQDLPDDLVGGALTLGYSLGLDKEKEMFGLHRRMQDITQINPKGNLQLHSLAEFIETQKRFTQHQMDINALYQEGKIPAHILADRANISLTDLYHSNLLENEKQPNYVSHPSLFIRHGGKKISAIENAQQQRLNMDITALLLASHLGVLETIEKVFRSIRMPSEVIPSLVEMRNKTLHHQPSRLNVANQIIDLVNKKLLKIADVVSVGSESKDKKLSDPLEIERKSFYELHEKTGYILDFLGHLDFYKSFADTSKIVYAKNIVDSLREHGKTLKDTYPIIVQDLGTEGRDSDYLTLPETGMPIFCFGNVVSILADANILELTCSQFDVFIQNDYLDQIRNEVAYFEKGRKQQFEWIGSLVEKLRDRLDTEKYLLIPPLLTKTDEHDMYGLQSIFSLTKEEYDLIWLDDRCLNGYSNINGIPIVGINEILLTLYEHGEIDQTKYYGLLHKMRIDNLCFVPVDADEIVYFILQAQIKDRVAIKTPELSILKQYIATAFLRGRILQKPPTNGESPNPQGELDFLFQTASAIADAVERIWSLSDVDIDEKDVYSSWIINNLFVSNLGLSEAIGLPQVNDNEMNLSALSFATLITRSLTITNRQKNGEISLQQIYLNWVYERVLRRSFESNPLMLKRTAEIIKKILIGIKDENTVFDNMLIDVYIQRFCSILPMPIFTEMKEDDDFAGSIGMRSVVTIGNWELKLEDFWFAAHEAVNGKDAEITPIGLDYMIVFQPYRSKDGITGILVRDPKGEQTLIQDSGIELLNESRDIQSRYLKKHIHWFDMPLDEFEKVSAEIISTNNIRERVEKALKWKEGNLKLFYSQLFVYLRDNRQFTGEDLVPSSIDGMLRFYRLTDYDVAVPFSEQWESIVEALIKSYGIEHALERASCVPLPMPELLLGTIDSMNLSEKRVLVKKLLRVSKSPIAVIQFVKLLVRFGEDSLIYRRLANCKINSMLTDDFISEVDSFIAVLNWVNYQFVINADLQNVSGELRLLMIWAHSHHIYSIFASLGVDSDWILNTFKQNLLPPIRLFEHETNFENNILNIRNINTRIIATYGVTYLIENYHEFMGEPLKGAIVNFVTIKNEGQIWPHPYLLGNPARAENPLNSFLGKDLSDQLQDLMGEEAKTFDYMNWKSLALATIRNLQEHSTSISLWNDLFAVLGVLAFDAEVNNKLSQTLRSINYVRLFEEDIKLGEKAIHIASIHLSCLHDSIVTDYLRDQIIEISELLSARYPQKAFGMLKDHEKEDISRLAGVLLEVALNISKKTESPEGRTIYFQKLGIEIVVRWGPFATITQPVLQYLCEILPPDQAKHLWKLLLFMRSVN